MTADPRRILLAGGPTGCWTNAGDEAVFLSMAEALRREHAGARITVVSSSPPGWFSARGFGETPYHDIPLLIEAARSSDLLVLGGGSIFYDYWGFDPSAVLTPRHSALSFYGGFAMLAALVGKPLVIDSVGAGPLQSEASREFTRDAFRVASSVTVRDSRSIDFLRSLGVDASTLTLKPDPAITFPSAPSAATDRLLEQVRSHGPVLAVALREWRSEIRGGEVIEREVAEALDVVAKRCGASFLFVPFHRRVEWPLTDDAGIAERVIARMRSGAPCIVADEAFSAAEKAALVRGADLVLAMRLHAAIFAVGAGVPVVGISYDPKVASFFGSAGLDDQCLDFDHLDRHSLSALIERSLAQPAELRTRVGAGRAALNGALDSAAEKLRGAETAPVPDAGATALKWLVAARARADAETAALRATLGGLERGSRSAETQQSATLLAGGLSAARENGSGAERPRPALQGRHRRVGILTNRLLDWTTHEPRFGGAERYCTDLAQLLTEEGFDVTIFQAAVGERFEGRYYGHKVIALPMGGHYAEYQYGVGDAFFYETADFDHVLYMMPNYGSGKMRDDALLISHGIWFDHDLLAPSITFRDAEWFGHLHRVFSRPRRVVSVDTNSANVIRCFWPELGERFTYIPNCVDIDRFHPPQTPDAGPVTVIIPRRIDILRGARLIVPVLDAIEGECRILWVGDGDGDEPARLRAATAHDPRFEIVGARFEEMPEMYRKAEICVIPTVASEGTSLSCLEGMASGCAVVATNVGGLGDLVQPDVNGLLVDPAPSQVARAINSLIEDVALRRRLQVAGRATAAHFNLQTWRQRWRAVLRDLGWIEARSESMTGGSARNA